MIVSCTFHTLGTRLLIGPTASFDSRPILVQRLCVSSQRPFKTCASLTRGFAFAVLLGMMVVKRHARGVSKKTLELYAVVFAARLASVLQHEGYLPYDKSGCVFASPSGIATCFGVFDALLWRL